LPPFDTCSGDVESPEVHAIIQCHIDLPITEFECVEGKLSLPNLNCVPEFEAWFAVCN
jgi:hypothetical protein